MSSHNLVSVTYKESDHLLIFLPIDIPEIEGKPFRQKYMHFFKLFNFLHMCIKLDSLHMCRAKEF